MARIMSFVMIVFTLVPALAPSMGAIVIAAAGWRAIFWAFVLFALTFSVWMSLRLPETHPPERRRPFRPAALGAAIREMFGYRVVRISIAVQTLCYAMLFSMLSSVQQIYDVSFGRGESFPLWFGGVAIVAASASFLNASLVGRLGMRRIVTGVLAFECVAALIMLGTAWAPLSLDQHFAAFVVWQATVFFMVGLTIGNVNALAMEPLGHIAGLAASLIAAVATVASVALAIPVGLMFDGTPVPLALALALESALALGLMLHMRRTDGQMTAAA
jgi:DHA1 family bicyclomycin/chloramphenicol resistance-like MFS transporter